VLVQAIQAMRIISIGDPPPWPCALRLGRSIAALPSRASAAACRDLREVPAQLRTIDHAADAHVVHDISEEDVASDSAPGFDESSGLQP